MPKKVCVRLQGGGRVIPKPDALALAVSEAEPLGSGRRSEANKRDEVRPIPIGLHFILDSLHFRLL